MVPIFSVAIISISHVVSWYDLANPISWAIYLSIAVEVAAMSAIAAASVKVKGFSVWFVFIIVTFIQFIGNIFFSYSEIKTDSKSFQDWCELTLPILESIGSDTKDLISQKRWLALLEGGLLPLISLTCLHFFIKYGETDESLQENETNIDAVEKSVEQVEEIVEEVEEPSIEQVDLATNDINSEQILSKTTLPTAPSAKKLDISAKMKKIIRK